MRERNQDRLKRLIVTRLKMKRAPESIGDDQALFGKEGLGLDSIDALELVVGMEEEWKIRVADNEMDRSVFATVSTLAALGVRSLAAHPPTLEELFMRQYGDEAHA